MLSFIFFWNFFEKSIDKYTHWVYNTVKSYKRKGDNNMLYVKSFSGYRVYELSVEECNRYNRINPSYLMWDCEEDIGNMYKITVEADNLKFIEEFCKEWSK